MKLHPIAALALLLGGCTKTVYVDRVVPKEVVVPGKPVACVPATLGAEPAYPDTDAALKAAADAAERYQLVAAGRKNRIARLNELEPVVKACRQ